MSCSPGSAWLTTVQSLVCCHPNQLTAVNLEGQTAYGQAYHGFWPTDLFSINPHFGTSEDLKALSDELHRRGMFLMVDTVLNHLASTSTSVEASKLEAEHMMFTDPSEYHPYCPVDYSNRESQLKCWMGDQKVALMDLNTENGGWYLPSRG